MGAVMVMMMMMIGRVVSLLEDLEAMLAHTTALAKTKQQQTRNTRHGVFEDTHSTRRAAAARGCEASQKAEATNTSEEAAAVRAP